MNEQRVIEEMDNVIAELASMEARIERLKSILLSVSVVLPRLVSRDTDFRTRAMAALDLCSIIASAVSEDQLPRAASDQDSEDNIPF